MNEKMEDDGIFEAVVMPDAIRGSLGCVFDKYSNKRNRIRELLVGYDKQLNRLENGEELRKKLIICVEIQDRDEFIDRTYSILFPAIQLAREECNNKS